MLARRGISFVSRFNPHFLKKLSFCSEAYRKIPNKNEAITDSLPVSDFPTSLHNLSPLFSDSTFRSYGYNFELVDHDAWRVSSGLSQAWQEKELVAPEESSTGAEETNELVDFNSSNFEDEVDFEDIDNMRIRGNLFYKLEKTSKEFEEYKFEFHRRKSPKKGDDNRKENPKKEKKASQSPKTSIAQEFKSTKIANNNMPLLHEANDTSVENKRQRTLTFNQLTGPYHEPFCLDIFISKASVRACVVHRVTSKVIAVAHSISKDMKLDFTSTKNKNTCAAVGALLAQRALADDIHDVIYTPRKGERLEGKLQIVLHSIIDHGINVKDKWRNLSVMANGWSSRDKSRLAVKRVHQIPKQDENAMATSSGVPSDEEQPMDAQAPQVPRDMLPIPGPERTIARLDNLIMEAITCLREHGGSNKTNISAYIEDQYGAPPDFRRLLSTKLKSLTASGKLIKVKRKYRIPPPPTYPDRRRNPSLLWTDGRQRVPIKIDKNEANVITKSQIDLELAKLRSMTAQEADAVAARAVAEAEAAIAEAEEAAKEAEAAEADAEAAQAFADAALKTLSGRNTPKLRHSVELMRA